MLKGKHILLGITGSIAAYKAAMLCRLLRVAGAEVKVVMTPTAKEFITPVTMATLSKNPIAVEFYNPENGDWHSHIAMGEWADCYLIKNTRVTADTEEIISGTRAVILKSSIRISSTKITPVMGALKIPDRAAATPQANISVRLR